MKIPEQYLEEAEKAYGEVMGLAPHWHAATRGAFITAIQSCIEDAMFALNEQQDEAIEKSEK